jgi:hypothetical protein
VEIASTLYRDPGFTLQAYKEGESCAVPDAPPDAPNHVSHSVAVTTKPAGLGLKG